jgi:hypothetical protein
VIGRKADHARHKTEFAPRAQSYVHSSRIVSTFQNHEHIEGGGGLRKVKILAYTCTQRKEKQYTQSVLPGLPHNTLLFRLKVMHADFYALSLDCFGLPGFLIGSATW